MPVRKVPKSYRNVTGLTGSKKAIGSAQFESPLESDFHTLLRFDSHVSAFEVQPVTIPTVTLDQNPGTYTPDALVFYRNDILPYRSWRPRLIEIKLREDLKKNWPELRIKYKAAIKYANRKHWTFKILTEKEIRTPYLKNASFLTTKQGNVVSFETYDLFRSKMQKLVKTTPYELVNSLPVKNDFEKAAALSAMWSLLSNKRVIYTDLTKELTMQSSIYFIEDNLEVFHHEQLRQPRTW